MVNVFFDFTQHLWQMLFLLLVSFKQKVFAERVQQTQGTVCLELDIDYGETLLQVVSVLSGW